VLNDLSEQIRNCYRRAAECERRAGQATDEAQRADFLDAAARWMKLAQSYATSERITAFNRSHGAASPCYFVMRRDASGRIATTLCHSVAEALQRLRELRHDRHPEAWIEDADGRRIDERSS